MHKCCPLNAGCNLLRAHQPCHYKCAKAHEDREAVEAMEFWWERYNKLPFYRPLLRREALDKFILNRDRALTSPRRFRPPLKPKPAGIKAD